MTFKLILNPTFLTRAMITVPTDAGPVEQSLNVRFKVLPDEAEALESTEFLRQAILHLDDIVDDGNDAIPYSTELLEQVIARPFARVGLVRAYYQALAGAKAGN